MMALRHAGCNRRVRTRLQHGARASRYDGFVETRNASAAGESTESVARTVVPSKRSIAIPGCGECRPSAAVA